MYYQVLPINVDPKEDVRTVEKKNWERERGGGFEKEYLFLVYLRLIYKFNFSIKLKFFI